MKHTNLMKTIAGLLLLGCVTGCLTDETSHTLYLHPDGSITVSILQLNIRSDGESAQARLKEENEFLMDARGNTHQAAKELLDLGAHSIRTTILREEQPYAVFTEGRVASIERLVSEILGDESDGRVVVTFESSDSEASLSIRCERDPYSDDAATSCDELHAAFSDAPLILTEGRFIRATGFEINDTGRRASMLSKEAFELNPEAQAVQYSLVWEAGSAN
jgi:hypothetical protein